VYAFSEENWTRENGEVLGLFGLAEAFARGKAAALAARGVRVRVIGRRDRLPRSVVEAFRILEERTARESAMLLTIAVDYGARTELRDACRALAREVVAGRLAPEQIDEESIAANLWTAGLPDPDLVVRTGGELRYRTSCSTSAPTRSCGRRSSRGPISMVRRSVARSRRTPFASAGSAARSFGRPPSGKPSFSSLTVTANGPTFRGDS